jgi:hypothetical protein
MKVGSRLIGVCVACIFLIIAALPARAVDTVRVDVTNGAPRIVVDGTAVRARIFFGGPGRRPIDLDPIGPAGRVMSFDFSPGIDAMGNGTIHFRFGDFPGDIYLDDLRMVDLDTGVDVIPLANFEGTSRDFEKDWAVWPVRGVDSGATVQVEEGKGPDGSPALHIQLRTPPNGKWPGFHFFHQANLPLKKEHHYRMSFWARSDQTRKLTIGLYRPGNPYVSLAQDVLPAQIKLAAAAGVNLISFPVALFWPKPGEAPDWTLVDSECQQVLDANPDALLVPRIGVYAPFWWIAEHPGESMVWDVPSQNGPMFDVASTLYRTDAKEHLAALITHLEAKFGQHMAGYHICGQNTAEWFYFGTWDSPLNGYAECDRRAWREWLKNRYCNDNALRAAWHDPKAALDTAEVPTPETRRAASAGVLRDSATEQPVIDFTEFQQQNMASVICELAHVVREATRGRKLVLSFYGYLFEFAGVHNGPGTSGHYALRQILDCPDIDVLCSPISYFNRDLGGNAPAMTAAESIALAGKMYLEEDDTRTYLALDDFGGPGDKAANLNETNELLVRNTTQCGLRNFATWWMDLAAVGWFDDPGIWAEMTRLKAVDQPMLDHPTPYRPEVAAVIDPESMMRVAYGGTVVTVPGVSDVREALGEMGCPFGQYLLDDVTAAKVSAKLYVFLTAWHLSPDQRRKLLDATRGATRIWCYAPGYQEGDHTSLDAMRELTGFRMKKLSNVIARAEPTGLGKKLGIKGALGISKSVEPLFAADDAKPDEVLATYPDGSAAIAMRRVGSDVSLFVGAPGLTPELLRVAADKGGVHLFTRTDCNVYANGPFLALHGAHDGVLDIDTARSEPIVDVMSGHQLGKGPRLTLKMNRGETRVFNIGDKP